MAAEVTGVLPWTKGLTVVQEFKEEVRLERDVPHDLFERVERLGKLSQIAPELERLINGKENESGFRVALVRLNEPVPCRDLADFVRKTSVGGIRFSTLNIRELFSFILGHADDVTLPRVNKPIIVVTTTYLGTFEIPRWPMFGQPVNNYNACRWFRSLTVDRMAANIVPAGTPLLVKRPRDY